MTVFLDDEFAVWYGHWLIMMNIEQWYQKMVDFTGINTIP